jgi:hypothetical protein
MDRCGFCRALSQESIFGLWQFDLHYLFPDLPSNILEVYDAVRTPFGSLLTMLGHLYRLFFRHNSIPIIPRLHVGVTPQGENADLPESSHRD